jgi:DNA-binding MarR family transcriptional regulator
MLNRGEARDVLEAASNYVREALRIDLRLRQCNGRSLPPYLLNSYAFACGRILGLRCVFMVGLATEAPSPASLAKQVARVKDSFARPAIYVTATLPAHQRKRLVAQGVPFIVPFTQLYLPPLGVDFRETARQRPIETSESFKPVTQVVLLYALLRRGEDELHAQSAAEALGYSQMSISRAFRDLEAAELAVRQSKGRSRPLKLAGAKREIWKRAQSRLVSPVRSRFLTSDRQLAGALEAGVTALARFSMISPPPERTVAVSSEAWRGIQRSTPVEPLSPTLLGEPGQMVVEVWTYSPLSLSHGPTVDMLSLALSLRDEHDERIEAALEDALESRLWRRSSRRSGTGSPTSRTAMS